VVSASAPAAERVPGDLTSDLIGTDWWTDEAVGGAGIPIVDAPFLSIGGGIGSFVTVDLLRIAGLAPDRIRVVSPTGYPWQTYEYLTRCSQIPLHERIRSDSSSIPDNIWGFPSLALREAWQDRSLRPLWNVATEPILADYWTPRLGMIFEGMEREARRIDWDSMVLPGQVRMVRRRYGGGYFTVVTPPAGTSATKRVAIRSRYAHLALGYPGVKFLDDLQAYRTTHEDYYRVVNAYEPHEHVYDELLARPGVVVVRGSGIVASRVLQRLIDDRDRNGAQTTIVHLFRHYVSGAHGTSVFSRRRGGHGWAHQGFNYPKSAWGGQHWATCRRLEGEERAAFYKKIGGTNTPLRRSWLEQLARGRSEGWYRVFVGSVTEVLPGPGGTVLSRLRGSNGSMQEFPASFVIDCTGLEADLREHRVMADLLDHGGAGRNPVGRLDVDRSFVVRGTESPPGKLYATGSMTLGGYFCGVDTFLGLQLAAMDVVDDLAADGLCRRIGVLRSTSQWWRRMRGKRP
jgi:pSer/pThr/pTyr-binding forkhead associated (FHA) protein